MMIVIQSSRNLEYAKLLLLVWTKYQVNTLRKKLKYYVFYLLSEAEAIAMIAQGQEDFEREHRFMQVNNFYIYF